MAKAVQDIRLLESAEWRVLRDIRLRALVESPRAFSSRYDDERGWAEHQWRQRFQAASWMVARDCGAVIGMAGLVKDHPEEPEHLESVWVAPSHRCRGVSRSLVDGVANLARHAGLLELLLWVLEDNLLAWRVYVRLGFEWTGERKPVDPRRRRFERRLRLVI